MTAGCALVVGGTGGLGQAICLRLASEWSGVAIGFRSRPQAAEALAERMAPGAGLPVRCDLLERASIERAFAEACARFGSIGSVVFAGGVEIGQPFASQIQEDQWREVIETELIGFTRVVAATLPHFRAQGHGTLVPVVSFANYHFPPGDALSAVPKAAIEVLGRALAKEEGRYGIRVNMVAPGVIDSGLGAAFLRSLYTPEIWEGQRKRVPLRRFGAGDEVAEAVAFLASDRSSYITGQTLLVDGGLSL